jgi:hypothetical protein
MKTIIRQILDDLKPGVRPPSDEIKNDTPKLNQPPITGGVFDPGKVEPHHNQGQIVIDASQPEAPTLETLHLDPKVLPPTPEDLNAQILSDDPAERLRQLDFQAQKSKERQIG